MSDILEQLEKVETKAKKGKLIEYDTEKHIIYRIYEELTKEHDFRLNDISKKIEFKEKDGEDWEMLADENVNTFWINFQLNPEFKGKEKPSDTLLYKLINSHLTTKYNAVREYFEALKWDGKNHFKEYCKLYTIAPLELENGKNITDIWQDLFKQWLISAVACMLGVSPNHVMLLLMGGQGLGKTTMLNNLCPPCLDKDYRYTGHIKPDLTDGTTANYLAEKVWLNIDDQLEQLFGKDFNAMKSLITIDKINNRKSYARFETSRKRVANFVGSVNQERIFVDSQNRRWLSLCVLEMEYKTKFNIDQLWAQIYHVFKSGARYYYNAEENKILNNINEKYAQITPEQEYFNLCYEVTEPTDSNAKYLQSSEILSTLKNVSGLNMRMNILSITFKKLGINTISKRFGKTSRWVYVLREKFIRDEATGKIKIIEIL